VKQLRREAKAAQGLVLKDELKSRRRALRRLGYVADEGVVTDKGADGRCRRAAPQFYCRGSARIPRAVALIAARGLRSWRRREQRACMFVSMLVLVTIPYIST